MAEYNEQQLAAGLQPIRCGSDMTSSDSAVDVAENWPSEFLQFVLYGCHRVAGAARVE